MLLQDVRYALRLMRQRAGYTVVVIATLALGIAANTTMFSVVEHVLLRPLPLGDPSRLVMIWENDRVNHRPRYPVAPANFNDWREQSHAFEQVAAFVNQGATLKGSGDPFHAAVAAVTTNLLQTLGVTPMLGRDFVLQDLPPAQHVLILSHATWMAHFGGSRDVIDRTVQLGETTYRIIGVMGPSFAFPDRTTEVWRPLAEPPEFLATRAQHFLHVIARIRPGVLMDQAHQDVESVAAGAQRIYPATNDQRGTTMVPLQEAMVGDVRTPMYLLAAAVGLLLLIACANVANLMLVQASARRREIAVRAALGADRFRIMRQLLVEGLLLGVAAGALGVAIADCGTRAVSRLAAGYVPRVTEAALDPWVLGFAAALSIGTGLLFSLAPALRASRSDIQQDLRDGARGTAGSGHATRRALVVVEFAAAVVLVAGAALLLKSFWRVLQIDPGFSTARVLSVDAELPQARYSTDAALAQFYADLVARLSAVPGIRAAGVVNNLPLTDNAWTAWLTIENRPKPAGEPPEVGYRSATPGYLAAMQIPLLDGRWFTDSDTRESQKVVVVNKALADRYFSAGDAVGSRVRLGPNAKAPWRTIVGVVDSVRHLGPESEAKPEAYEVFAQDPFEGTVVVRADGDPGAVVAAVRETVRAVDPSVVVWRMRWMESLMDEHLAPRRLSLRLVEGFAAVALGLALLGIYGVVSYTVAQRVPEIGVRIALGAAPGEIHRMILRDGLRLALPGLVGGTVAAAAVARIVRSVLFDVSPTDPATFCTVIALVLAVSVLACYVPARRAARIDPLRAIRES